MNRRITRRITRSQSCSNVATITDATPIIHATSIPTPPRDVCTATAVEGHVDTPSRPPRDWDSSMTLHSNSTQMPSMRRTLPVIPATPSIISQQLVDELAAIKTVLLDLKETVIGNSTAVRGLSDRVSYLEGIGVSSSPSNSCATQCEAPYVQPKRTVPRSQLVGTAFTPLQTSNQFEPLSDGSDDHPAISDNEDHRDVETHSETQRNRPDSSHRRRRPVVCCTESYLKNFQPIRPGKSTYARAAQNGKKVLVLSDSMCQRIRKREFNQYVQNGFAKIKCYPGDTPNHIHNNVIPHLIEECPHTLVIHAGTNSLHDTTRSAEQIADEILSIGASARELGVETVIVTGLIIRKNGRDIDVKRREVNTHLRSKSANNHFQFITNNNISMNDICWDRVHLEESGCVKLANNILCALNSINQ